jgi:hypothetical protein
MHVPRMQRLFKDMLDLVHNQWDRGNLEFYYCEKTLTYNDHKQKIVARSLYLLTQ